MYGTKISYNIKQTDDYIYVDMRDIDSLSLHQVPFTKCLTWFNAQNYCRNWYGTDLASHDEGVAT